MKTKILILILFVIGMRGAYAQSTSANLELVWLEYNSEQKCYFPISASFEYFERTASAAQVREIELKMERYTKPYLCQREILTFPRWLEKMPKAARAIADRLEQQAGTYFQPAIKSSEMQDVASTIGESIAVHESARSIRDKISTLRRISSTIESMKGGCPNVMGQEFEIVDQNHPPEHGFAGKGILYICPGVELPTF